MLPERKKKQVVPDLIGLKEETARIVATRAGFENIAVHFTDSYEPEWSVVSQDPEKGILADTSREIKLYVSRRSLLRFLPAVYQQAPLNEKFFLMDFLWIIQHILDSVNRKIDKLHRIFDPLLTDEEFLPWLAGWLGFSFEPDMPVRQRRNLLRSVSDIYKIRGTASGLKFLMKLFVGIEPEIFENRWPYKGFRVGVSSAIGIDTIIFPPINLAHTFIVKIPVRFNEISEEKLLKIHEILRREKPAHTMYFLQFKDETGLSEYEGILRIGIDSRIGVEAEETVKRG